MPPLTRRYHACPSTVIFVLQIRDFFTKMSNLNIFFSCFLFLQVASSPQLFSFSKNNVGLTPTFFKNSLVSAPQIPLHLSSFHLLPSSFT